MCSSLLLLLTTLAAGTHSHFTHCSPSVTKLGGRICGKISQVCSGRLVFEDNFDELDFEKWEHERTLAGGGSWEFQWYDNSRRNSFTKNGILYIKPSITADEIQNIYSDTVSLDGGTPASSCTNPSNYGCTRTGNQMHVINPVKSARIRTVNSCFFKYGRLQVKAKMPAGDWLWPAIWLLPRHNAYGNLPLSGEIDIVESRGNKYLTQNGRNIGSKLMGSTLHWGPNYFNNRYNMTHWVKTNPNGFDADFHVYELQWTPDKISFYVDNEIVGEISPPEGGFWEYGNFSSTLFNPWQNQDKMAPFNQPFFIVINLAVGGLDYFPDDADNYLTQKPWKNTSPRAASDFWEGRGNWLPSWNLHTDDAALKVDYIRLYAL